MDIPFGGSYQLITKVRKMIAADWAWLWFRSHRVLKVSKILCSYITKLCGDEPVHRLTYALQYCCTLYIFISLQTCQCQCCADKWRRWEKESIQWTGIVTGIPGNGRHCQHWPAWGIWCIKNSYIAYTVTPKGTLDNWNDFCRNLLAAEIQLKITREI